MLVTHRLDVCVLESGAFQRVIDGEPSAEGPFPEMRPEFTSRPARVCGAERQWGSFLSGILRTSP